MDKIIDFMLQDNSDIEIDMGEDYSDKELDNDWEYEDEPSLDKSSGDRADDNENDVSNTGIVDTPDEGDSVGDQENEPLFPLMNSTFTQNNESDNEISSIEEESEIPSSPESPPVIPVPAKRVRTRGGISQQRGIRQRGGHGVG